MFIPRFIIIGCFKSALRGRIPACGHDTMIMFSHTNIG